MFLNELLFIGHALIVSGSVFLALSYSYGALLTVMAVQMIAANLFVTKQIALFGMHTTCSEVFVVGGMYGISLVRDYYDAQTARRCVWAVFAFFLLFTVLSHFHMAYLGVDGLVAGALDRVSHSTIRLCGASLLAYVVSERVHLWLTYAHAGVHSRAWHNVARVGAIVGGQIVDTVIFAVVGLWGIVDDLVPVILFSLLVKIIIIATLSPLLLITHRFVQARSQ